LGDRQAIRLASKRGWRTRRRRCVQSFIHTIFFFFSLRGPLSIVNIGLLSLAGRAFYVNPEFRRDPTVISSTVAIAVIVTSAEGYLAERYHRTPEGKEVEWRARQEGSYIYRQFKEHVLRPGYLGGLVGVGTSFPFLDFMSSSLSLS
jgi:hypothetical protein